MTTRIIGGTGIEFPDATQQITQGVPNTAPAFIGAYDGPGGLSNNTLQKILAITALYDNVDGWDEGTDNYTPGVPGLYQVSFRLQAEGTTSLNYVTAYVFRNGANAASGSVAPYAGRFASASIDRLLLLQDPSDYLTFYVNVNGTGSLTVHGVYASAHLVRAL